jgi:hypothetical protein
VVLYVPPPPENVLLSELSGWSIFQLLTPPLSFRLRANIEIGVISFALTLIVPTKAAVGVYVSEVPLAFGPNVNVEDAALVVAAVCKVPMATVTVPPPIVEVSTAGPVQVSVPLVTVAPVGVPV